MEPQIKEPKIIYVGYENYVSLMTKQDELPEQIAQIILQTNAIDPHGDMYICESEGDTLPKMKNIHLCTEIDKFTPEFFRYKVKHILRYIKKQKIQPGLLVIVSNGNKRAFSKVSAENLSYIVSEALEDVYNDTDKTQIMFVIQEDWNYIYEMGMKSSKRKTKKGKKNKKKKG